MPGQLGKRSPSLRPSLSIGEYLLATTPTLPAHPADDPIPQFSYPMDRNDVAGDCVVAAVDHALQTIYGQLGVPRANWDDATLLRYYQTQNPGFTDWSQGGGPNDGGMDIQTFLEHLVAEGTILAFGRLDHTDEELLKAAAYVGLAVVTGELLEVAQQSQNVWDYSPSGQWGGHATCTVAYQAKPDEQFLVTWGQVLPATQSFWAHQLDEAWFILTQAHVDHPAFRDSFDLANFAVAISELTGGKVVVPVPAPPAPAPTPTPVPPVPVPVPVPDPLADFPFAAMDAFASWPRHWKRATTAAHAYLAWKTEHNL